MSFITPPPAAVIRDASPEDLVANTDRSAHGIDDVAAHELPEHRRKGCFKWPKALLFNATRKIFRLLCTKYLGILGVMVVLGICSVSGSVVVVFFTDYFGWQLVVATILRLISLSITVIPVLCRSSTCRIQHRATFATCCLLSFVSVVVAWPIWLLHIPKYPLVLLAVSDLCLVVATFHLAIFGSAAPATGREIDMDVLGSAVDSEAQQTQY